MGACVCRGGSFDSDRGGLGLRGVVGDGVELPLVVQLQLGEFLPQLVSLLFFLFLSGRKGGDIR